MTTLRICLLGESRFSYGGELLTKVNKQPLLQELVAYLLLNRATPQSREHISFLFWPDSREDRARTNLRSALHQLRLALPDAESFLIIERQTLQWRLDASYALDVAEFEELITSANRLTSEHNPAAARKALEKALATYSGDLLPGCYDDWIREDRDRLRVAYSKALDQLIQLLEEHGDYAGAIRYAQRRLRDDGESEYCHRHLMRLFALNNERAHALRIYYDCVSMLQREFAIEPDTETQQVYQEILKREAPDAPAASAATGLASQWPLVGRSDEWRTLVAAWEAAEPWAAASGLDFRGSGDG